MPGPRSDIDRAWRELTHWLQERGIRETEAPTSPSCGTTSFPYANEVILALNDLRRRERLRSYDVRLLKRAMRALVNHVLAPHERA